MNITETHSYDKDGHIERWPSLNRLFPALVVLLVAGVSFGLGRLSAGGESSPIKIEYDQSLTIDNQAPVVPSQAAAAINGLGQSPAPTVGAGEVVVSKNGNKYHYPHCAGAKQIKEENRVIFVSPTAAEAAGYTLAANCQPK